MRPTSEKVFANIARRNLLEGVLLKKVLVLGLLLRAAATTCLLADQVGRASKLLAYTSGPIRAHKCEQILLVL